jgi:hypothetical protein
MENISGIADASRLLSPISINVPVIILTMLYKNESPLYRTSIIPDVSVMFTSCIVRTVDFLLRLSDEKPLKS